MNLSKYSNIFGVISVLGCIPVITLGFFNLIILQFIALLIQLIAMMLYFKTIKK